jgi:hypothetical protein
MKLRAPDGCTSVSHDGRSYCVEADGSLEVEESVAAALTAHGFAPWRNEAPRDVADMTRDELIMRVMDMTLQTLKASETEALRNRLRAVEAKDLPDERAGSGVKVDPDAIAENIESLNRPALFALLREKGVRVALPISNVELRAAARRAAASESDREDS